jgi:Transposase IS66 family
MGKAVSYTLAQWESLEVYLKESEIEIDNNLSRMRSDLQLLGRRSGYFSVTLMQANAARSFTR